jgi:glyoxylase-like metal-dependent hydrolase (beta-lactamase superfamily II)
MTTTRNWAQNHSGACVYSFAAAVFTTLVVAGPAFASEADRFAAVEVTAQHVRGSVHMLTGAGGNIGLSVGKDGTLLIDDQYGPLAERIQNAVNESGGATPKLVLNTHYHGDHTGSNAHFGAAGTIIAHENVRIRLVNADSVDPIALPVVTYQDRIRVFFNGDTIDVIHMPTGHTDGDSVIWFKNANVIHMGDQLFNGSFPYVDIPGGGSVAGYAANLAKILQMVPADIIVIPGHGAITDVAGISESLEMITATNEIVMQASAAGSSPDEIVAAGLAARWERFGQGFINEERWIRILLASAESR